MVSDEEACARACPYPSLRPKASLSLCLSLSLTPDLASGENQLANLLFLLLPSCGGSGRRFNFFKSPNDGKARYDRG